MTILDCFRQYDVCFSVQCEIKDFKSRYALHSGPSSPCTATPHIRSDQIMAPFKGAVLIPEQQAFNEAMSARCVC